jgi:putative ABC transport system substrate-binding protein
MSPSPNHEAAVNNADTASKALALTLVPVIASTSADFDDAFATMHEQHCEALLVLSDPRINRRVIELAETFSLPAMYQATGFVEMGRLMSYSADLTELFQLAAIYVDKILKGASPADLPVEQPTKFVLEINLKTAKALGLTVPNSIVVSADKVIE